MAAVPGPLSASKKLPVRVNDILQKAKKSWLEPPEIACLLTEDALRRMVCTEPPQRPPGGSLFLVDRAACRSFRQDGHDWEKKRDGNIKENHMKLKVDGVDTLNCYYSYCRQGGGGGGAQAPGGGAPQLPLTRRSYWLLEEEEGLVLVHYRRSAKKGSQQKQQLQQQRGPGARKTQASRHRRKLSLVDEGEEGEEAVVPTSKRARSKAAPAAPEEAVAAEQPSPASQQQQESRRLQRRRQQQAQYAAASTAAGAETAVAEPPQQRQPALPQPQSQQPAELDLPWNSGNLLEMELPNWTSCHLLPQGGAGTAGGATEHPLGERAGTGATSASLLADGGGLMLLTLSWSLPADPPLPSDPLGLGGAAEPSTLLGQGGGSGGSGGLTPATPASQPEGSLARSSPGSGEWMEEWLATRALGGGGAGAALLDYGDAHAMGPAPSFEGALMDVAIEELTLEFVHLQPPSGPSKWQRALGCVKAVNRLRARALQGAHRRSQSM